MIDGPDWRGSTPAVAVPPRPGWCEMGEALAPGTFKRRCRPVGFAALSLLLLLVLAPVLPVSVGEASLAAENQDADRAASAVVRGTVQDDTNGEPLQAATIQLLDPAGRRLAAVVTDDEGRFLIGRAPEGDVVVSAERIGYLISQRELTLTAGDTVAVEFRLEPSAVLMDPLRVTAQRELRPPQCTEQIVIGRLLDDDTRDPVPGGTVHLMTSQLELLESFGVRPQGDFVVVVPAAGSYVLSAEAPGYPTSHSDNLHIIPGDTLHVDFHLSTERVISGPILVDMTMEDDDTPIAAALSEVAGPVVVTASARSWRDRYAMTLRGQFFRRVAVCRRPNPSGSLSGEFLDRNRIAAWDGTDRLDRMISDEIMFMGNCKPAILVDGFPTDAASLPWDYYTPDMLEAVEAYEPPRIPPEYEYSSNACGVIVLWTRLPEDQPERAPLWQRGLIGLGVFLALVLVGA